MNFDKFEQIDKFGTAEVSLSIHPETKYIIVIKTILQKFLDTKDQDILKKFKSYI